MYERVSIVSAPVTIKLKDYKPTIFVIDSVSLKVEIFDDHSKVTNTMKMKQRDNNSGALVLHGENQTLLSVSIDGNELTSDEYKLSDELLTIEKPGSDFEIEIVSKNDPSKNNSFMASTCLKEIISPNARPKGSAELHIIMTDQIACLSSQLELKLTKPNFLSSFKRQYH